MKELYKSSKRHISCTGGTRKAATGMERWATGMRGLLEG